MHRGYLVGSLARYAECWEILHQAEMSAKNLGLNLLRAEVLWRRGMISVFAGEYDSAEKKLASALEIAYGENDRQLQALTTAGQAKNLMYQRKDIEAIARFEEALAIFEELEAAFYVATVRGELGTCYLHGGHRWRLSVPRRIHCCNLLLAAGAGIGATIGRPALGFKVAAKSLPQLFSPRESGLGARI